MTLCMPVALLVLVLALLPAVPASGTAVTIQADAAHSGNAGAAGLRAPLTRRWTRSVGGVPGYPVIAGGRVFAAVSSPPRSFVMAVDARRGRVLWTRDLPDADSAALAYADGRLFVARESYTDNQSGVLALDPADGRIVWATGTGMFSATAPVAVGGVVYVNGLNSVGVTALRATDGVTLW